MTILYCDCFSGISGDMFLGAMLDAGLPEAYLTEQLQQLHLPEFSAARGQKVKKGSIAATLLSFDLNQEDHHHIHEHRHFSDIAGMIQQSHLPAEVQHTSLAIFDQLANAEARVHDTSVEEVHFHEVGATDSILDIVGAAVGLHYFNIQKVFASPVPLGSGAVKTQHGLLPIPAPATLELLTKANAIITPSPARVEMVTPTGAAILATLATFNQPEMVLERTGIGAGRREMEWPNIMRLLFGQPGGISTAHIEIETNIDDMNPQLFGVVMQKCFEAGALDVYFTPIAMKKNRPGTKLSIIARKEQELSLAQILLEETTTLGVRVHAVNRHEAEREMAQVETPYGVVPVKLKKLNGQVVQATPEFDNCVQLAQKAGVPVARVLSAAVSCGEEFFTIRKKVSPSSVIE
ncbi:MAG TPA: nickel pincer cofactor biosynthesis protein LarC [Anaerolineaceae bacterium]|nr:nickel pincer cofactor biosynthesis protein LarC [Anaerolineaceae bacterium]HPN51687.1 nickel pincer cofactor biosynthesis protein LarC [Anaerolineaceae bacterium]